MVRRRCRMCDSELVVEVGSVDGFRFVECRSCGFTFAPHIDAAMVRRLYLLGQGPESGEGVPRDTGFLRTALDGLGEGPHQMLDFGCGGSRLPHLLRQQGHRVVAVDLAPPLRPHPDRLTGDLLELHLPSARFDLVFAFQVFEHLPEPRPILRELLRLVRPGGFVVVHTDMEPPVRVEPLERWAYVSPPDHCALFRHRTFERALADTAHTIVEREPSCVTIQVDGEALRAA